MLDVSIFDALSYNKMDLENIARSFTTEHISKYSGLVGAHFYLPRLDLKFYQHNVPTLLVQDHQQYYARCRGSKCTTRFAL